jgi:hypothetical protein
VVSSHTLQASYKSGTHRGNYHYDQSRGKQRIHGAPVRGEKRQCHQRLHHTGNSKGAAITGVYPIAIADNQPAASTAGQ